MLFNLESVHSWKKARNQIRDHVEKSIHATLSQVADHICAAEHADLYGEYRAHLLQTLLETEDVAVSITATHFCVKARGVMDANSRTTTTSLGGRFLKFVDVLPTDVTTGEAD